MNWYDRAEQELEDGLTLGHLTQKEFNAEMRELRREYQQARNDAAKETYENY